MMELSKSLKIGGKRKKTEIYHQYHEVYEELARDHLIHQVKILNLNKDDCETKIKKKDLEAKQKVMMDVSNSYNEVNICMSYLLNPIDMVMVMRNFQCCTQQAIKIYMAKPKNKKKHQCWVMDVKSGFTAAPLSMFGDCFLQE